MAWRPKVCKRDGMWRVYFWKWSGRTMAIFSTLPKAYDWAARVCGGGVYRG